MNAQESLYTRLCDERTLFEAWKTVKAKNAAGGIDGMTVARFDEDVEGGIRDLAEALRGGTWSPQPYKSIKIPKNDNETRQLGLLSVRDKIAQCAIKMLVEPIFEKLFVNNSYGYRPGKGHARAVRRALFESRKGDNHWVVRLDIDNYFDNINHDVLAERLRKLIPDGEIVRLLMLSMRMGVVDKRLKWSDREEGVPQGAVLSPLLSNFYLHPFDEYVLTLSPSYVRYADDFCVMCGSRSKATEIYGSIKDYLHEHYALGLNEPVINELWRGFEFLGITIAKSGLSLSAKKEMDLEERIVSTTLTPTGLSADSARSWDGIRNYYGTLLPENILVRLDGMLYDHVRRSISEEGYKTIASRAALKRMVEGIHYLSNEYQLHSSRLINNYIEVYERAKSGKRAPTDKERNEQIIERRKAEYRKRESEGCELVVNTYGSFMGISRQCVTVKNNGRVTARKPGASLSHIIVSGNGVSLSSNLIVYCMNNKIPVDFFSLSGVHIGSLLSNKYIEGTLWNEQAQCGSAKRLALAAAIIDAKIRNQFSLIKYFHKYHKAAHGSLSTCYDDMSAFYDEFRTFMKTASADSDDFLKEMVQQEAQGALKYWAYVRELLTDDDVGFERRVHKGATDLVNCMLNYGYAILYSRVWQALLGAKLNPYDSIVHVRQAGKPTFVYDVVEMFRAQVVDRVVITLIQKKAPLNIDKGLLDGSSRKQLAKSVLERINRYEKYRGKELTMGQIIHRQASEIAAWIEKDKRYKPYIARW